MQEESLRKWLVNNERREEAEENVEVKERYESTRLIFEKIDTNEILREE